MSENSPAGVASNHKPQEPVDPEVIEAKPVGEARGATGAVTFSTTISHRSGILPEPSELAAYGKIIPNGAERIMAMAEAQSSHRISMEKSVIASQQKQEDRGQWLAFIIALVFGTLGTYAAIVGQPTFGSIIAGTTLVGLVSVFVIAKHQSGKELSESRNRNMMPPQSVAGPGEISKKRGKKNHRR